MKRRTFLGTSSLLLLSGCTTGNNDNTTTEPNDTVEENNNSAGTDNTNESDETTTEDDRPDTGESVDVSITQQEWAPQGEAAEFLIANQDNTVASVELVVEWFDANGHYLDADRISTPALEGGRSWFTRVERSAFFTGTEDIGPIEATDFEAFVSGVEIPTELPRGVDIISTEFDSDLLRVEGLIENQQSTVTDLEVLVTGYNGDWLTYSGGERASNVPPETTWRYQLFLDNVAPDDTEIDDDIELYVW